MQSAIVISPRALGQFMSHPVGLGCMNLSHAYGTPPSEEQSIALLNTALDLGYTMMDTATLYGFGANESLLAKAIGHRRSEFILASKCGMGKGPDGKRLIDGRPETIRQQCEASLKRLNTDVIDLYYLHRWDRQVPIEESVGALSDLVTAGKIREIGLSEVSAQTYLKAHAVHPIAAVQSEYSLWTRNPEISLLEQCRAKGTAFVAFSPVGRGALTGKIRQPDQFVPNDIRHGMPRFQAEHWQANLDLVDQLYTCVSDEFDLGHDVSGTATITLASVVLAWVLSQGDFIHVIPGTANLTHLAENMLSAQIQLSPALCAKMAALFAPEAVHGHRYNAATQQEIDTEQYAFEKDGASV